MADDTKKQGENEIPEEESKDWQWDAAAPTVGDDFLDLGTIIPDKEDTEESDLPADEKEQIQPESDDEEIVIEEPEEETNDEPSQAEDGCCIICGSKGLRITETNHQEE